jgi:sRNA-binding protein
MNYKFDRQELEDAIQKLAELYPKTFFVIPSQRRPLKRNIVADLERDGAPIASELISTAVSWYESHYGYKYAIQTGAKRVDLTGADCGTVTATECQEAQQQIAADKKRQREKNLNRPIETMTRLHQTRHATDDDLRKIDAPSAEMPKVKESTPPSSPPVADSFAEFQKLIEGLRRFVAATPVPMRAAYFAFLNAEVQRLMSEAHHG